MKYMNVPFFKHFTPICSFLLGFKVGRYANPSFKCIKNTVKLLQYTKMTFRYLHVGNFYVFPMFDFWCIIVPYMFVLFSSKWF